MSECRIKTTTVGSYPVPDWLAALPSETALIDATRNVFAMQRQIGIDLPTDGEFYRYDVNHPDTNGMIDYFVRPMGGVRQAIGRTQAEKFRKYQPMSFRRKPAGVIIGQIDEGALDLITDCQRAANVAGGPFKFTITSPYMLARTLLDDFYGMFETVVMKIADVLAHQVRGLPCACVQIDEANIAGNPQDAPLAMKGINRVLDSVDPGTKKAVHLCFGNYGGQTIQHGSWKSLIGFLNGLHCDHIVMEIAHRPLEDLEALRAIDPKIGIGVGVIDIKVNAIESPDDIALRLQRAEETLGEGRIQYIHPDCGLWMIKRSVADRKLDAMVKGRNLYLAHCG